MIVSWSQKYHFQRAGKSFHVFPEYKEAEEGDNVTFICKSKIRKKHWYFKDGGFAPNVEVSFDTLTIYGVQLSNSGIYACVNVDKGGRQKESHGELLVTCELVSHQQLVQDVGLGRGEGRG